MKKLLAVLIVLALCLSILPIAAAASDEHTLYLKPNSNWLNDGARFAVLLANSDWSTQVWYDMADEDADGYYSATVPVGDFVTAIFCRMNPNSTENGWGNKWNQTSDLTLPTDGSNCYTVADGTWDKGGGVWSVFGSGEPVPTPVPVYVVAGDAGLTGVNWDPSAAANKMTLDGTLYSITFEDILPGTYGLKVVMNGLWDTSWPGSNYTITLEAVSDVTVTFDPATYTVSHTATPTGEIVDIVDKYVLAGDAALTGEEWNPNSEANQLTEEDGIYKISYQNVAAGTYYFKIVKNNSWGTSWPSDNYELVVEVTSDITVSFDPATNEIHVAQTPVSVPGPDPDPQPEPVYIVAGSAGLCGSEWNGTDTANQMTKVDGKYIKVYENVNAGTYQLKVVKDGTTWIPDSNIQVTAKQGATVTVTYDPDANTVTAVAEGGTEPIVPVEHVYIVAGSAGLCGSEWNGTDENNKMTLGEDGKYIKVYTNVPAGTYALKVVMDGTTWIPDGMGGDIIVTAKEGATVTVTYDPSNTETPVTAVAEGGVDPEVPVEDTYHVVGSGSIFGGSLWTAEDDHLMVKGEDGKYTKVYTVIAAGELGIKVLKNGVLYIPDGMGTEIKVTVKKGATVTVTFDPSNTETPITVTAVGGEEEPSQEEPPQEEIPPVVIDPDAVYYVAGVKELCGSEWSCDDPANQMTLDPATGTYSITYSNLVPNTRYAFKVTDGSWDHSWPASDREFAVAKAGAVTITFHPATGEVTLSDNAIKYVPALSDSDKLVVAGSSALCGSEWNSTDEANQLVKNADGSYSITYQGVAPGDYELKIVLNGSTWIGGVDGNNVKLTVTKTCDVTITYTAAGGIRVSGANIIVENTHNPQTGDMTDLSILFGLMLLASTGLAVTLSQKKKFF